MQTMTTKIARAMTFAVLAFTASTSPRAAPSQVQLEDLEFARTEYVMKSKAFSTADRRQALAYIDSLEAPSSVMSHEQFLLAVLRIVAYAHNAHDSFDFADGWVPPTRLPLRMIWFADALVIARAAPEYGALLGARVERINGATPSELLIRLRAVCTAPDGYLRWNVNWIIESGGLLHALGVGRSADSVDLELTLRDGRRIKQVVAFVPRRETPPGAGPVRLWSARPYAAEIERGWRTAAIANGEPFYLREADAAFRMDRLPDIDALYVQFRANSTADARGQEIAPFVAQVRAAVEASPPTNLVLDLRFDIGGDIGQTRQLMRILAANVKRRVYVLIGPYTFSAGIVSAAAIKHDGGERVTLVGDQVGDRLRFWSEAERACLPHAQYCLHASTGLWDLTAGCSGEPDCYGDQFDANVGSLAPQLRAPLTAASWLAGRDPGMEAIRADIARRSNVGRVR